ncbi:MAG: hypothetical protein ACREM8_09150 [Vulcanimicrobiaceae bacterium]
MKKLALILPIVAGGIAVALGGFSNPAVARVTEGGPVAIDSCSVGNGGRYGGRIGNVAISYRNLRPIALDRVVFQVNYRGVRRRITDSGTFSQGALIRHNFSNLNGVPFSGPNPDNCTVIAAQSVDGRWWGRRGHDKF